MRFAYADPPYLGCCRHYRHHHPDGACWDDLGTHAALIAQLSEGWPDGWALSASSPSLRAVLPLCPPDVRVAAWVKPFHALKRGVRPSYGWEPVIFRGGRNVGHPPPAKGASATTPRDFLAEPIALRRGLVGAKPPRVCEWILDMLGHRPGQDTVDDLYPGTAGHDGGRVGSHRVNLRRRRWRSSVSAPRNRWGWGFQPGYDSGPAPIMVLPVVPAGPGPGNHLEAPMGWTLPDTAPRETAGSLGLCGPLEESPPAGPVTDAHVVAIRANLPTWHNDPGWAQETITRLCDALDAARLESRNAVRERDGAHREAAALPAWTCPSCGAETRARMADHPPATDLEAVHAVMAAAMHNLLALGLSGPWHRIAVEHLGMAKDAAVRAATGSTP